MSEPVAPAPPGAVLWGRIIDQTADTRPARGRVRLTALHPHVPDSSTTDGLHHQSPVKVPLDADGRFEFAAQDGDTEWLVQLVATTSALPVWSRLWTPVPGLVTNVRDLPEVDPATLAPSEDAVPAWTAAVEQVRGLRDDAYALLPMMESVTGAAAAVHAEALAAIAAAEAAALDAGQAGQHRQAAEQAAEQAATDAQAIIAQATADAIAAVRAETTRTHYHPTIGWITTRGHA